MQCVKGYRKKIGGEVEKNGKEVAKKRRDNRTEKKSQVKDISVNEKIKKKGQRCKRARVKEWRGKG